MADNVTANPGSGGPNFAADDIGGVYFPRTKLALGADGVNDGDVSAANPLPVSGPLTDAQLRASAVPVSAASLPLPTGAALASGQPDIRTDHPLFGDRGAVVRQAPADIWSVGFARVGSGLLEPEFTTRVTGTGVTVSQSASNLVIAAGTTTNAEFLARSVASFRGAFIARIKTILSQRIANNNFAFMLADKIGEGLSCTINSATSITVSAPGHAFTSQNVGQFMFVGGISGAAGVPGRYAIASVVAGTSITFTVAGWPASGSCTVDLFGWNWHRILYNGATATAAAADTQRRGWNSGDTTLTVNTTASPGHVIQIMEDGRNVYFADSLVASSVTPTFATRGSRFENIPDDDVELYVYIWSFNGTVAPASSTTWTIGFVAVEDLLNSPVYIGGVRPLGAAAALPVAQVGSNTVTGTVSVNALPAGTSAIGDVGQQYRANATGAASGTHIVSAATTNATVVKAGAGRVLGWHLANTSAAWKYVKLHNQTTTPTAGTGVVRTIAIPPNGVADFALEGGIAFATGIGLTIVNGAADADATAVAANDVVGDLFFS